MKGTRSALESPNVREVRIRLVAGNELQNKIHDAVACRAFQLFEAQGCAAGHDTEHWERAQAQVVRPLDCGVIVQDHRVCLTADMSCLEEGRIDVWVEPHRLTLAGIDAKRRPIEGTLGEPARSRMEGTFLVHDFAVEVNSAEVTARFNGPVLNIYLAKAGVREKEHELAMAV
jgi:HSP20 family molecular chaperone IbpA